jgi:peptidase M28-like protein
MNNKYNPILIIVLSLTVIMSSNAQMERINNTINQLEAESHLRFLTADELKGRDTGTDELLIAGRYIAEQFRRSGLLPLGDTEGDYLQRVPIHNSKPPTSATLTLLGEELKRGVDMALLSGSNGTVKGPLVYLTDLEDYDSVGVNGKIVVTILRDVMGSGDRDLVKLIQKAGAVSIIHLYGSGMQYPWSIVVNYFSKERMSLADTDEVTSEFPHLLVRDSAFLYLQQLKEKTDLSAFINISGMEKKNVKAFNIIGLVEGTDPALKKEHMVMCAHFDHVGIQPGEAGQDSIYNGTRDNGIGTTGLINAAKYFGKYPPKRSVIIIALTGEEKGLLGSSYYVDNPKIPLEETVFTLNIDNSGYTDTDVLTLLDTSRTNIDELVYQAASEVGLGVIGDRIPNQNYYERSDQFSFAKKGVPAVNFKMAMTAFDERISKYYHQPSDEFQTVDLEYIHKYWKAYIRAAELIGNWDQKPYWIKGDKFESTGNELYKID